MKKLFTLAIFAASFTTNAFILEGQETIVPQEVVQYCATADNYWVCVENKMKLDEADSFI